ncbi:MAG TPA: hypothetical protein VF756_17365, partial [Thermoanaerobaculia bacterium]
IDTIPARDIAAPAGGASALASGDPAAGTAELDVFTVVITLQRSMTSYSMRIVILASEFVKGSMMEIYEGREGPDSHRHPP